MRQQTLQEQYNLIVEGKGNPSAFHKQALKQFPNLFTAQSSYDQVITVLKQKSIISEMVAQGLVSNSSGPNFFEIFNTNMAKINEEAKAEEKKADEHAVEAEKKTAKDKTDKNIDNQNGAEFLLGFYVESRNSKNVDKTVEDIRDIVVKNLAKDPLHYVKSGQFGVEDLGYKEDVPGLGQTKEVKGKYASSGMEPVKLKESKQVNETYGNEINVPTPSMLLQMDGDRLKRAIDKMDHNDMAAFKRKMENTEVSVKNALKDKVKSFELNVGTLKLLGLDINESKDALVKEILKRLTGK